MSEKDDSVELSTSLSRFAPEKKNASLLWHRKWAGTVFYPAETPVNALGKMK